MHLLTLNAALTIEPGPTFTHSEGQQWQYLAIKAAQINKPSSVRAQPYGTSQELTKFSASKGALSHYVNNTESI